MKDFAYHFPFHVHVRRSICCDLSYSYLINYAFVSAVKSNASGIHFILCKSPIYHKTAYSIIQRSSIESFISHPGLNRICRHKPDVGGHVLYRMSRANPSICTDARDFPVIYKLVYFKFIIIINYLYI